MTYSGQPDQRKTRSNVFILVRAFTYATLLVGLGLLVLPPDALSGLGVTRPTAIHITQVGGIAVGVGGGALALWCVITFAIIGRGTPLPFDPPRRLVVRGPYRFVRNPMAIGVALTLTGAALYYRSVRLMAFTGLFLVVIHLFVVLYEEPTLRRYVWRRLRSLFASGAPVVAAILNRSRIRHPAARGGRH